MRGFVGAVVFWIGVVLLWSTPQASRKLEVTVRDLSNLAIPGVRVELQAGDSRVGQADTSVDGHALFFDLKPANYRVSILLKGFQPVVRDLDLSSEEAPATLEVTLRPEAERTKVEVTAETTPVEQGASAPTTISG